jgi:hypothetical protein
MSRDYAGEVSAMKKQLSILGGIVAVTAVTLVVPVASQEAATPSTPTKKDPLRFSAFAVSMPAGQAGVVDIVIERWTTDPERAALLELLSASSFKSGGQTKLLRALQKVKPRTGYIRTSRSLAWDLRYARENLLQDGTRQIVIATDKPVSFLAASSGARVMDYPFSFIEMRMKPDDKGEGRLLVATSVDVKNGRLELENYGQEPVRLTTITQESPKKK